MPSKKIKDAAGTLIFARHQNRHKFLVAREGPTHPKAPNQISSWGGLANDNETFKESAIRETWEETHGQLGTQNHIEQLISKSKYKPIFNINPTMRTTTFPIKISYNNYLPIAINNAIIFSEQSGQRPEKSPTTQWMTFEQLIANKKSVRPCLLRDIKKFIATIKTTD